MGAVHVPAGLQSRLESNAPLPKTSELCNSRDDSNSIRTAPPTSRGNQTSILAREGPELSCRPDT